MKDNVIYMAKAKKTEKCLGIKEGKYYRCARKTSRNTGDVCWHTDHYVPNWLGGPGFTFDWDDTTWWDCFEKPITIYEYEVLQLCNIFTNVYKDPLNKQYQFQSDKPNFNLLAADLFEDGIPVAFISNGDRHFIAGIWDNIFDWFEIFEKFIKKDKYFNEVYEIYEVDNPEECKKMVKEYTERYNNRIKTMRKKTANRTKSLKKKTTWGVYTSE